ncbi:TPA: conjugal transfer protein, partial [Streptococcus equi subsp. equi]|nr:conjugal transfer protein [Streptococcus equi subsp. equi]
MNKKYRKNIEKQKDIQKKIEELQLKQEMLKEEQEEMENIEVLKEYRSIDIS